MPAIWDAQFGFVRDGAPLLVGEWGGWLTGRDAVWQRAFAAYLRARHIGSFYWSLLTPLQRAFGASRNTRHPGCQMRRFFGVSNLV